jgi:hypothetical protein
MNSTFFKVRGTSGMFFGKIGTLQWIFLMYNEKERGERTD